MRRGPEVGELGWEVCVFAHMSVVWASFHFSREKATSARWQNRKPQTSFLDLTIIYMIQKSLYESSRNQLGSHNTPRPSQSQEQLHCCGYVKPFHCNHICPSPGQHSLQLRWKVQLTVSPLERKNKSGTYVQCVSFSQGCLRDRFLSCLMWNADGKPAYLGCLGATENKRELSSLWNSMEQKEQAQFTMIRSKHSCSISLERERKEWNVHPTIQFFRGCWKDWFLFCLT